MLGACNTCKATVQSHKLKCHVDGLVCFAFFLFVFYYRDGVVLKILVFHQGWWQEALTGRNTGVLRWKLGSVISAGQSNGGFFGLVWGSKV